MRDNMKQAISRKTAKNIAILIGVNLAFITLTVGLAVLHPIWGSNGFYCDIHSSCSDRSAICDHSTLQSPQSHETIKNEKLLTTSNH